MEATENKNFWAGDGSHRLQYGLVITLMALEVMTLGFIITASILDMATNEDSWAFGFMIVLGSPLVLF